MSKQSVWSVVPVDGGYVVTWRGEAWGMTPRDEAWCRDYMARLEERYPEGGAWLLDGSDSTRTRGGPWRYTYADGETEVIHTSRLDDAKSVLRHRLRRKTLPAGLTWTLEEDSHG
jgi:hypothetical protein